MAKKTLAWQNPNHGKIPAEEIKFGLSWNHYIYIYGPKATFTHRCRLSVWITKKLGLVGFWLVATFFELLVLISYHQKFMAIYNNISFLLSASLISCFPYDCSQTFLSANDESSRALRVLRMFAFDESHDLVMIPIFLPLTTWKSHHSCSRWTNLFLHCWRLLLLNCSL
jgi:hypothetical protein